MTNLFELVLLLKKSPIFSEVNTEDLRVVAQVLEEERYAAGDRVFDIGHQGDDMYILMSGRVGISIEDDPGSTSYIAELGESECFGEMGLLDDLPRSATATVLDESVILTLGRARLRALITRYPELALGMLRSMSLRLREANTR